jgi:Transposase DDE domain group 1
MLLPQVIDPKQGFRVKKVKLEVSKERLVGNAGLGTIVGLFDKSSLSKEFAKCLPKRESYNSCGSYRMGLILVSSLIHGDDCLDDIDEEFSGNPSVEEFFDGGIPTSRSFGNFLRDFSDENIEKLQLFLVQMGYKIRNHLKYQSLSDDAKPESLIHFSVDSTFHEQSGDKIENCAYNYEGRWGLSSEVVYDEMGIAYGARLLAGNAKPGVKGPELLSEVLAPLRGKKIENPFERVAHISGDSAYAFEEFIKTCQSHHATFTIAARGNIPWEKEVEHITTWEEWKYSSKEILKLSKRGKGLPERYLARWHWSPSWGPQLKFPIIIKKEWKEDPVFENTGHWHYHAVITNEDLFKTSYQEVYSRYQRRANMENFMKDAKMGFDAYHLPCLAFRANHAYFLMLLIAQNMLRWVSLLSEPNKPHYAKKLRRKFIFNAGKVVSHARTLTLKVSEKFKKEVEKLEEAWRSEPTIIPLTYSSA